MARTGAVLVRVFGNRRLRRAELAFVGFSLSEYAVWTAILVYAYERGGTTAAGLIAVVQLVPAAIIAPFAAGVTDRRGGGYALVLGYVLQALSMGATAVAMLVDGPALVVYAFAIVAASAVTLSRPAQATLISSLAEHPDELTGAAAVSGWIEAISALAGPALAGIALAIDGPGVVFAASAVAMAVAALEVAPLRSDRGRGDDEQESLEEGVLAGIRALRSQRQARALVTLIGAEHLAIGALDVLVVVLAISVLGLGSPGAGYLNAAFGVGAVFGGLAGVTLATSRRVGLPLVAAALVWGATFIGLSAVKSPAAAFVLLPLAGLCQAVLDTGGRALLVSVTPHELLARVFGVLEGVLMASLAVGSLLVPVLVAIGGVTAALIGVAVILIASALLPIAGLRGLNTVAPAAAMASVRRNPLFAALPAPVLEALAREVSPVTAAAGERLIVQGDDGDRFYLIVNGEFDVDIDGRFVRTLLPGEGFGEIALLREVPRTANVTARTDGLLYALEREPFIDALRPAV
ncbi:MAG TPA: cyclic nucleotide-binding domain-containing protein [Solirubrobacteraceae bacterium]